MNLRRFHLEIGIIFKDKAAMQLKNFQDMARKLLIFIKIIL